MQKLMSAPTYGGANDVAIRIHRETPGAPEV